MQSPVDPIERDAPRGAELRRALYDGRIFSCAATEASRALVDRTHELLRSELGPEPRTAIFALGDEEHFARIGRIRRVLFLEREFHDAIARVLDAFGLLSDRIAVDPLRLRTVAHLGHHNPRAKAVYYPHRDTWYGHPTSLVTAWIPLDDLCADETFVFYPERFRAAVPNNSEIFDYDEWVSSGDALKIGWQQRNSGLEAEYPGALEPIDGGREVGFSCERAANLFFSGAHFHKTLPQAKERTRFSLDFRFVDLADHEAGLGAPNVDGRARGSALRDYVRLAP
jgi:hypothetical protein